MGGQRIQEHGLHNWFGFYDNAFAQIRQVYRSSHRPRGAPLRTLDEAFEPADEAVFVERLPSGPQLWTIHNVVNTARPGEGGLWDSPWDYVEEALEALLRMLVGSGAPRARRRAPAPAPHGAPGGAGDAPRRRRARPPPARPPGEPHPLADRLAAEAVHDAPAWIRDLEGAALQAFCLLLWGFTSVLWDSLRGGDLLSPARADRAAALDHGQPHAAP